RHKDSRGHANGIEPPIGEDCLIHLPDGLAVGDIRRETKGWSAAGDFSARHADARPVFLFDLFGCGIGRFTVQIDAHDVSAFIDEPMGSFLPDAAARPDDDDNLAGEFLLRRHSSQLGLFEQPVFDVEGFLFAATRYIHRLLPRRASLPRRNCRTPRSLATRIYRSPMRSSPARGGASRKVL